MLAKVTMIGDRLCYFLGCAWDDLDVNLGVRYSFWLRHRLGKTQARSWKDKLEHGLLCYVIFVIMTQSCCLIFCSLLSCIIDLKLYIVYISTYMLETM